MKSTNSNPLTRINVIQLEKHLKSLRVDESQGKLALQKSLRILNSIDQTNEDRIQSNSWHFWFSKTTALAAGLSALLILIIGSSWLISQNSSNVVVSSQTQANGSVVNASNTQIQDAQDDSTIGNDDTAQINTANARLQSVKTIGESINESQF